MMDKNPSPYYVPHHSPWPIVGALALLIIAFSSLHLTEKWGFVGLLLGLLLLLVTIGGWLGSVIKESDTGLYHQQMDKTFRWGMFWFLISELFLFGLLLGTIFHVRFSITPWLAGQGGTASMLTHYLLWPDFSQHWPLLTPPVKATATTDAPILAYTKSMPFPLLNLLLLILSALLGILSPFFLKRGQRQKSVVLLNLAIPWGILFLGLQTDYLFSLLKISIIVKTGIYGSLLMIFLGFHSINILAALLLLIGSSIRLYQQKLTSANTFLLDAGIWWWSFLTGIALLAFFLLFVP